AEASDQTEHLPAKAVNVAARRRRSDRPGRAPRRPRRPLPPANAGRRTARDLRFYRSPLAAKRLIRSAARQAMAWMVRDGLTPPTVGKTDPSQIQRLRISQLRQSASTTLVRGSAPMRAVPLR